MSKYLKIIDNSATFMSIEDTCVPRYSRINFAFAKTSGVDRIIFKCPNSIQEHVIAFIHQPARLLYDVHGYETIEPVGEEVLCARYTPDTLGDYKYEAMAGEQVIQKGTFSCIESEHPGYVKVSKKDPRYFETSDGNAFCPIGLNLAALDSYRLPAGAEYFSTSNERVYLGMEEIKRWFKRMNENGANFARIWLTQYFNVEGEIYGELDNAAFAKIDAIVEYARTYNIRLKLVFEHFRTVKPGSFATKNATHPDGSKLCSMHEWFTEEKWQCLWWNKINAYMHRHANDPTIAMWELWNEIDAVAEIKWEELRDWTFKTIPMVKEKSPKNLVVNSLGSYDSDWAKPHYEEFKNDVIDSQQVHRYLDQGAPYEICHNDPVAFSVDAINTARRPDKPVLLAETGAVNNIHTGPFRFYRWDDRGIIFHDTTYPAFFAGAAGSGHIWHWNDYVDNKNLWRYFSPLAQIVEGVNFAAEAFEVVDYSTNNVYFLGLKGEGTFLGWMRNKADTWQNEFIHQKPVPVVANETFTDTGFSEEMVMEFTVINCWEDETAKLELKERTIFLKDLKYGLVFKAAY
ncbi:MAG: glycoside hydrolase family 5 protein [Firmicutes bacterium]|nr:glycoside hydrolase family 5 protein [Bacillota bacterium]